MHIKKYLYSPFFYLLLTVVGYLSFTKITDTDFGFHLAQGKYFFDHHWQLPIKEIFSYTIAGQTNIILSWLFDVGAYFTYSKLGFWGISLWKALVFAILAILFILRLEQLATGKKINLNQGFTYAATLLFLAAVYPWATVERPHAVGYLYFSLFLLLMNVFIGQTRSWHWFALAGLQLLWVNTHTSFTVSMIIAVIFIVGLYIEYLDKKRWPKLYRGGELEEIIGKIKKLVWLLGLVVVVSLLNPYGINVFANFLKASPSGAYKFIQELWPMQLKDFVTWRGLFWVLSIFPLISFWRKKNYKLVLLFAAFAFLGLSSSRFSFDYVVLTAPLTMMEIFGWAPFFFNNFVTGLVMTLIFGSFFVSAANQKERSVGFSINDFPVGAANFILANNLTGRMYNSFGTGSYLIWHLFPRYQVFIDTRAQNYVQHGRNSLLLDYYAVLGDVAAWQKMDEKYNFDFAVVDWPFIDNGKLYNLTDKNFPTDKWALVFMDAKAIVYLKRTEANKRLIEEHEYKYIQPQKIDPSYIQEYLRSPYDWLMALSEFRRALEQSPDNYRLHFLYAAFLAQNSASDQAEIVEHLKKAADLNYKFTQPRKILKTAFKVNY